MSIISDIRVDIGDDGATPIFSDAQLIALIGKASNRLNRKLYLTGTSDEINVDAAGEITPSTDTMSDLIILQVECMLMQRTMQGSFNTGADGLSVHDGEQSIDTTSRAGARATVLNSDHNPCAELEDAIKQEMLRRAGNGTKMVW